MSAVRPRQTSSRLEAELYALTHRGNAGDAEFYERMCAGASSVLELGSGDGRLLATLARPGRRLVGLDLDPELSAAGRRRLRRVPPALRGTLQLVLGDMRNFELKERFERVILGYNGLYCLLAKREALACFRAVRRVLAPGGLFVFDVWNAEAFHHRTAESLADQAEPIVSLRHAGHTWDVFERSRVRRASQRLHVTYEYLPRGASPPLRITIPQRYFRAAELRELLQRAGFRIQTRYGDFFGARFGRHSPQLIVVASAR